MAVKDLLNEKLREAMRSHDEDAKRVYRMILSSVKFAEKTNGRELQDNEIVQILQKELKIRKETLAEAEKGGRTAVADEAMKDITAIEALLPKQLTEEELKAIVADVIKEVDAKSAADMGKVMKAVMPKVNGLAANAMVSKTVKELLS